MYFLIDKDGNQLKKLPLKQKFRAAFPFNSPPKPFHTALAAHFNSDLCPESWGISHTWQNKIYMGKWTVYLQDENFYFLLFLSCGWIQGSVPRRHQGAATHRHSEAQTPHQPGTWGQLLSSLHHRQIYWSTLDDQTPPQSWWTDTCAELVWPRAWFRQCSRNARSYCLYSTSVVRQINQLKTTFKVQVCIKEEYPLQPPAHPSIAGVWMWRSCPMPPGTQWAPAWRGCRAATEMWEQQGPGRVWNTPPSAQRSWSRLPRPPCVPSGSGHSQWAGWPGCQPPCPGGRLWASPYTAAPAPSPSPPWAEGPLPRGQHASLPSVFWSCALSSAPWEQPNTGPVRCRLARTQGPRKGWSFLEKGEAQPCTGQSP